ncbi:hypothetical protein FHW79_006554 [Azospirillum sp. OGB3]|uniref:hypothetical protein n=1 Tax=Azospirillum sp. OGB3 TaxID=2587012 RepID=UPI00160673D1|nr:hypothetical protein [Azospirillum sp. OGB3]MBB3268876.1 hypothetical protein [Azospirillum sp. OGB3]
MSRYDVTTIDPAGTACVVGWDNPLQTFFAQVERVMPDPDDDPDILLWVGDRASSCLDVAELAEAIAPWAVLPCSVAKKLETERDTALPPTRVQAALHNILRTVAS